MPEQEIICVRALTVSDMGWFGVHRSTTPSKQRAVNINANIAARLLSSRAFDEGGVQLVCNCVFSGAAHKEKRRLWKVGKNWRFGGPKLEGDLFRQIRPGDFFLLRSHLHNDGDREVSLNFISAISDKETHEWLMQCEPSLQSDSMAAVVTGTEVFKSLSAKYFSITSAQEVDAGYSAQSARSNPVKRAAVPPIPPLPNVAAGPRTVQERMRSPHIMSQMLKVSADLSAEAQYEFIKALELLAGQLRQLLSAAGLIQTVQRNHKQTWSEVRGSKIAFVDGGMANLSMLGSAPVAARVGGYIVTPGDRTDNREQFRITKQLIDELYSTAPSEGIFAQGFPDIGALRDAARISVESAGAVHILRDQPDVKYLFLHGALVNPVSRYTDIMENGRPVALFPNFTPKALDLLMPPNVQVKTGEDSNFVRVYLGQLEFLEKSSCVVCGVVERESQATTVHKALVDILASRPEVIPLLPMSPDSWAHWFKGMAEAFRITDALLFRCVLLPGEVLVPVEIDRNDLRRAPSKWAGDIGLYPQPWISYMLPTEWGQPVRIELFHKNIPDFVELARLVMHCAWLLPNYAFPVGLDIVDKFAKVPNWMAKPINTNTAVRALRKALDAGDSTTFDTLRRMLCGTTRDWLFRPKAF